MRPCACGLRYEEWRLTDPMPCVCKQVYSRRRGPEVVAEGFPKRIEHEGATVPDVLLMGGHRAFHASRGGEDVKDAYAGLAKKLAP